MESSKCGTTNGQLDRLPEFFSKIETRLLAGAREYGDKSFKKDPRELIEEITQELLDVCGWSYILYRRLEILKQAMRDCTISEHDVRAVEELTRSDIRRCAGTPYYCKGCAVHSSTDTCSRCGNSLPDPMP